MSMNQIQLKGLRALTMLEDGKYTLDELADKLCICRRYAQQVLKHLKDSGYVIFSQAKGRTKYFWKIAESNFLPAMLTPSERVAVKDALISQNSDLQSAVYKMTQLANLQLNFQSIKE